MSEQKYLRVKELALMLSISCATVWRWTKTKKGFPQPIHLSKGITVWSKNEVEDWISQCRK